MSDYTTSEVCAAAKAYVNPYGEEFWVAAGYTKKLHLVLRGEEVPVTVVEAGTGGEGHGESCHIVIQVGDQLFRQDGSYYSYDGTIWDGNLYEVQAVTRQATFYERKY